MNQDTYRVPLFVSYAEISSSILSAFKKGNSITNMHYVTSDLFGPYQAHTEIYKKLITGHFSTKLKSVDINMYDFVEPENEQEVTDRQKIIHVLLNNLQEKCKKI